MSVPFGRAVLTLDDITRQIRRTFEQFTDPRRGKNTRYTLVDAGLSAFSVFFLIQCLLLTTNLEELMLVESLPQALIKLLQDLRRQGT